ncbi:13833_t:CDS:1 [Acaulospora morrowiae]|uniref:13833_t:CDS:1 n=1 Tax=Acaulospora morrowiae TaxID=94023 RepID=A0A9N9CMK8_9GLOM|nr:13833_t:CDS:1 [Acaulospora morrowiae]
MDSSRIVKKDEAGTRLEKFVCRHFRDIVISKHLCRLCFKRGEILINGKPAESTRLICEGDEVCLQIDKIALERDRLDMPITLNYEDEYLAIVTKGAGVHMKGLKEGLTFVLNEGLVVDKCEYTCINLLPRGVSGLIVVSKTSEVRMKLAKMLNLGEIRQRYRIIVHGKYEHSVFQNQGFEAQQIYLTRSTSGDGNYLTTLDIINSHSLISASDIKKNFAKIHHHVVGSNSCTKELNSCKGKGIMMVLLEIMFQHPMTEKQIIVKIDEPSKFEIIRQRESRFYDAKRNEEIEELHRYGLEPLENHDPQDLQQTPIAYITGEKEFFNLRFHVTSDTMIPRSSTEHLVHATLDVYHESKYFNFHGIDATENQSFAFLDVGTGSGSILISVLHSIITSINQAMPITSPIMASHSLLGIGLDINVGALEVARRNATRHLDPLIVRNNYQREIFRYDFIHADMSNLHNYTQLFHKKFDVLVCNPPYLDNSSNLSKNDKRLCEPPEALFSDEGGFQAYRLLYETLELSFTEGKDILRKDASVIVEVGSKMAEKVKQLFRDWNCVKCIKDNQGFERCLVFRRHKY